MSIFQLYRNLTFKSQVGLGLSLIAWGVAGLLVVDKTEEKLGLKPTDKDMEDLSRMVPKIRTVEPVKDQDK
ncbi:hypothetical protein B0T17DRAFT_615522 [Bombardia bombarda]|uniref:Uncharacterized protein n=1 Tax=Bombardia bombarda TaxID=252184 RepID=A0AA39X9T3_9PEZI|nr:hypothetical protein B0T17DRAFT_615522 [Bombardia bombarda]